MARKPERPRITFCAHHRQGVEKSTLARAFFNQIRLWRNKSTFGGWNRFAMKSALRQEMEADLISYEAVGWRFHPSPLGFHRAKHDFIDYFETLWYNNDRKAEISRDFSAFFVPKFFEFPSIHFRFFFESKDSNYRKRTFSWIEYGTQATGRTWTHDRVSNSSGFLRSSQNVYK